MNTKLTELSDTKLNVGIDVHKKQWSVTIFTQQIHHRTFSQPPSSGALKQCIDHRFPGTLVEYAYEATRFDF